MNLTVTFQFNGSIINCLINGTGIISYPWKNTMPYIYFSKQAGETYDIILVPYTTIGFKELNGHKFSFVSLGTVWRNQLFFCAVHSMVAGTRKHSVNICRI